MELSVGMLRRRVVIVCAVTYVPPLPRQGVRGKRDAYGSARTRILRYVTFGMAFELRIGRAESGSEKEGTGHAKQSPQGKRHHWRAARRVKRPTSPIAETDRARSPRRSIECNGCNQTDRPPPVEPQGLMDHSGSPAADARLNQSQREWAVSAKTSSLTASDPQHCMYNSNLSNPTRSRVTLKLKVAGRSSAREDKPPPPSEPRNKAKPGAQWSDEHKERMQAEMDALLR